MVDLPPEVLALLVHDTVGGEAGHHTTTAPQSRHRVKLIKIGTKVVAHAKCVTFQLAEVAVPRQLFAQILEWIARLCPACASG